MTVEEVAGKPRESDGPTGITDELRSFTKDPLLGYASQSQHIARLTAIADRIDAEHERQLDVLYRDMSDAEWVCLPKDADGVPIRVGDRMDKGKVTCIRDCGKGWEIILDNRSMYDAPSLHHGKPTVEDLLREFAQRWDDPMRYDRDEMVEQYAAKLRLADDREEA